MMHDATSRSIIIVLIVFQERRQTEVCNKKMFEVVTKLDYDHRRLCIPS